MRMRSLTFLALLVAACSPRIVVVKRTPPSRPDLALDGDPDGGAPDPDGGGGGDAASDVDGAAPDAAGADQAAPPVLVIHLGYVWVSTLAGSDQPGEVDGPPSVALFDNPAGMILGPDGFLYVTDYDGKRVRRVTLDGIASTLPAPTIFDGPFGIDFDRNGALLVQTDYDPTGNKSASSGTLWLQTPGTWGVAPFVQSLGRPRGLATTPAGVVVVDRVLQTVSLLDTASGAMTLLAGAAGQAGCTDGAGADARFDSPNGVAVLPDGSLVIADTANHTLRKLTLDGTVTTLAGDGTMGTVDGPALQARFVQPRALAVDGSGAVYITDIGSHRVRCLGTDGIVRTVAGDGTAGFADGDSEVAEFYGLEGIAVAPGGRRIFVTDGNIGDGSMHHRLRVIDL